jgi:hypothetical protein
VWKHRAQVLGWLLNLGLAMAQHSSSVFTNMSTVQPDRGMLPPVIRIKLVGFVCLIGVMGGVELGSLPRCTEALGIATSC